MAGDRVNRPAISNPDALLIVKDNGGGPQPPERGDKRGFASHAKPHPNREVTDRQEGLAGAIERHHQPPTNTRVQGMRGLHAAKLALWAVDA
jgi:hypothetical protein